MADYGFHSRGSRHAINAWILNCVDRKNTITTSSLQSVRRGVDFGGKAFHSYGLLPSDRKGAPLPTTPFLTVTL
jgi:hypothetical protein